jgi:iron-sulfur cluster repair protein YtfE (RIC family)
MREPLDALIDHIVTTCHRPLREQLPALEAMAAKVCRRTGQGHRSWLASRMPSVNCRRT